MPYNKGDFTQQGINGDVSALVRLNEKRVMKVVLSSDDESDNCDISGKVYDLLNGTSYDVGSGGGGGGGDTLLKTTLTIINEYDEGITKPTIGVYGYRVIPHQFNSESSNRLYTNLDGASRPYILISDDPTADFTMSIPAGTTVSYDFYYLNIYDTTNMGLLFAGDPQATATNMTYIEEPGVWAVTDDEENSSLTITLTN